jgi:predicted HD phosphohydrolase
MPGAHVFSYSVRGPVHAHESARCMRKPFGEPAATSARALGYSRLHAGAQRHACPAFAAFEPVEPLSADLYALTGRGRWRTGGSTTAWRR